MIDLKYKTILHCSEARCVNWILTYNHHLVCCLSQPVTLIRTAGEYLLLCSRTVDFEWFVFGCFCFIIFFNQNHKHLTTKTHVDSWLLMVWEGLPANTCLWKLGKSDQRFSLARTWSSTYKGSPRCGWAMVCRTFTRHNNRFVFLFELKIKSSLESSWEGCNRCSVVCVVVLISDMIWAITIAQC